MDDSETQAIEDSILGVPLTRDNILSRFDVFAEQVKGLEAAKVEAETAKVEAEKKYEEAREEHAKEAARRWELENDYVDKCRELQQCQLLLRNSIPLGDWINPPPKMRRASEMKPSEKIQVLKKELESLQESIRLLELEEDKSQSVNIGA
ncbi:hypothetical protein SAMD00023353_0100620 [Rosellinia necatrix]|uniref:Uncharacterized protein n=1 Tax=Rosellinia necatrix TaxID=77044 RepID=A0A1S7UHA6_ROSNE|nr:hypothetical protein SAMD00023353_0100620 [Rosellinia necatrix]